MRQLGKVSKSGGNNKEERLKKATEEYLKTANKLKAKLQQSKDGLPIENMTDLAKSIELEYYIAMVEKHIDLVDRRLLQGETIPNEEKIYSIFETYTDFIKKGKSRPNVELGKKLSVSTDQFGLILHHKVWDHVADSSMSIEIASDLLEAGYAMKSLSFDKGFWSPKDKELLDLYIPLVVMPKRGKRTKEQQSIESGKEYKKLKNEHQAVESNINELENRSLDRCPDRGKKNFNRYCAMGVCAYNLHKIGTQIMKQKLALEKKSRKRACIKQPKPSKKIISTKAMAHICPVSSNCFKNRNLLTNFDADKQKNYNSL